MEYTQNIHVAWVNFIEYMWNTLGYNFPLYPNVFHIIQHRIQYRIYYNIPDNKLPHFDNKPPCIRARRRSIYFHGAFVDPR